MGTLRNQAARQAPVLRMPHCHDVGILTRLKPGMIYNGSYDLMIAPKEDTCKSGFKETFGKSFIKISQSF